MIKRLGFLQTLAVNLGKILPYKIGELFYLIPFWIFRLLLKSHSGTLWFRNSLAFKDIIFGFSDIDLTFYFESSFDRKSVLEIEKKLKLLKYVFPHLGEISYYDHELLSEFLPYANPLELARDPMLIKRENLKDHLLINHCDKIVFALNWLRNDLHKMKKSFSSREKKIKRFLSSLDIKEDLSELQKWSDVLFVVQKNVFKVVVKKEELFINFFAKFYVIDIKDEQSINEFYNENPDLRICFLICYPQIWIGPALKFEGFEDDLDLLKGCSEDLVAVFKAQIAWEEWGLYGQWMQSGSDIDFHIHVENLLRCVNYFHKEEVFLTRGLTLLSSLHEENNLFVDRDAG